MVPWPIPTDQSIETKLNRLVRALQRSGLAPLVSSLLELNSAFAAVAAQGLYAASPLAEAWVPRRTLHELAEIMEDPQRVAELAQALKESPE